MSAAAKSWEAVAIMHRRAAAVWKDRAVTAELEVVRLQSLFKEIEARLEVLEETLRHGTNPVAVAPDVGDVVEKCEATEGFPCPNCGHPGCHYAPPSIGEPGFYTCKTKSNV